MSRQTPTSRRSPSILVTDVRHQKAHSAPFVSRRLNSVSVESLLSNTSEVPSAQRRAVPRRAWPQNTTSNYGNSPHRSRMAGSARRTSEATPLLDSGAASSLTPSAPLTYDTTANSEVPKNTAPPQTSETPAGSPHRLKSAFTSVRKHSFGRNDKKPVKPVPQLSKSLPSRTSKQSQRLVLIPEADTESSRGYLGRDSAVSSSSTASAASSSATGTVTRHRRPFTDDNEPSDEDAMRVTSYLISEGVLLPKVAKYLKEQHRARVRLYDEALFADYLLPLLPGNGTEFRVMSSVGDNRTMERLIDISEQRDHHYEYFSASETDLDPSEPQDFSPRPNSDAPINHHNLHSHHHTSHHHNKPHHNKNGAGASTNDNTDVAVTDEEEETNSNSHNNNNNNNNNSSSNDDDNNSNISADTSSAEESSSEEETEEDRRKREKQQWDKERKLEQYTSHAEIFVFNYGVVVFWNFTEAQEKQILADLCIGDENLVIHPCSDQEIQSEELEFTYTLEDNEKPRIFNDLITLNSNSHMLKLAMSHAMAQSTILCGFEDRMQAHLKDVRGVPKTLALTGKLGLNREQLLKISGRLFKLRVDVNLSSNVLDIPEFFWDSEPSLFPLFNALREYLEIDERVLVLNERQSVFLELTSILGDTIAEFNMDRITIIVIWLIVLSICVSLTEIAVRFFTLLKQGQ